MITHKFKCLFKKKKSVVEIYDQSCKFLEPNTELPEATGSLLAWEGLREAGPPLGAAGSLAVGG